jgi:hypothetical protein
MTIFSRSRKAAAPQARHNKRSRTVQAPAVQRPDLTALYAPEHPYLPTSIDLLRSRADWCRAEAADLDTQATDFISRAARLRIEAVDFDRIAALAEQDIAFPEQDPQPPTEPRTPAAGHFVHWLSGHDFWPACGEQGFGAKWATPHAAAVTCPTCQADSEGERVLPNEPWTPTSEADAAGWNEPLPPSVTGTAVLEAVDGGSR